MELGLYFKNYGLLVFQAAIYRNGARSVFSNISISQFKNGGNNKDGARFVLLNKKYPRLKMDIVQK